ncbi:uncharacterized protein LOC106169429 [Lingula anatina]|uniref:Uncharacterized protein LOC106169429 n=1 Tax=Lingula anatina TaxID=7574 RepID=A0A1S3J251_LINAN|nr:uncharacterized protein LOC106169429 [Lingula anatina]|eukprot:XP_013404341.1 uncharacterized protein LOC106169429 [Lingula anatina]
MSAVTDSDILDGRVLLEDGRMVFHPYHLSPNAKCSLVFDESGRGFVSNAGWVIEVIKSIQVNGTGYTGTLDEINSMFYGEYIMKPGRMGNWPYAKSLKYKTPTPATLLKSGVYTYETKASWDGIKGQSYGRFTIDAKNGKIDGTETFIV